MESQNQQSSSSSTSSIFFSIKHIIQFIYFEKIVSFMLWEEVLDNMSEIILNQPSSIVNLYFILKNAVANFGVREVSQAELVRQKEKERSLEEIINFFSEEINDENFNLETINYETVILFKDLVKESKKINDIQFDLNINNEKDNEDDDDNDDDDDDDDEKTEDEFNKVFDKIMKKNKRKQKKQLHTKFQQSFQIITDGERKTLKTTGEDGSFLIDIRVTDCRDLRTVHPDDWWQKANKKAVFVTQSTKDPLFISINNILKLALNRIKLTPNVKSTTYSISKSRFKPY